jgi:MFS family permease
MQNKALGANKLANIIPWLMVGLGALFYSYESLLRQSPSVMNYEIMHHYHIGATGFAHLVAYYYYIYAPMQLFVGVLMDKYGARFLLTFAAFCCAFGAYLFVESDYLIVAEVGRFLVGLGSSFAFVGLLKLATSWLPPERFAVITGSAMAIGMVGCLVGDVALTSVIDSYGWQGASYRAAAFGGVLAILMFLFLKDSGSSAKIDDVANQEQLTFKDVIANLIDLLKSRQIWINGIIGCLMWLPLSVFAETWGVFYLEHVYYLSKQLAGDAVAMVFLGWAVGGPIMGWFSDKIKQRRMPITVGSMFAALMIILVLYVPVISYESLLIILFLFGFFNSAQAIVFAVSREISPAKAVASSFAVTNMFIMISGIIQPVSGYLLETISSKSNTVNAVAQYSATAYQAALSIVPIGLLITVCLSFLLKESYSENTDSHYK